MAPLKYEDNMREKLEKRVIKPSTSSWDKLANKLDEAEEKKSKKGILWFAGIAASIIGILWVSLTLNSSESIYPIEQQIVDTPKIKTIENQQKEIIDESPKEFIVDVQTKPQKSQPKKSESIVAKAIDKQKSRTNNKEEVIVENAIAEVIETKKIEKVQTNLMSLDDAVKNENVEAVVAQIVELKEQNKEMTDAEIDALLNKAQDEIRLKKLYKNNSKTIDAMALLQDVEADLDRSFREKVFEALKINYKNVKTAVAQRND